MKRLQTVTTALLIGSTALLASEAYAPIAYGVKNLGMGGAGIALPNGAQSAFLNPALLPLAPNNEIAVGDTYTRQDIKTVNTDYSGGLTTIENFENKERTHTPYIAVNNKVSDNVGIGILAASYELKHSIGNNTGTVSSKYTKTRFALPVGYTMDNLSLGVSYIHEKLTSELTSTGGGSYTQNNNKSGSGYALGMLYTLEDTGVNLGLDYQSKIKKVAPKKIGAGIAWRIPNSGHSVALDYTRIYTSDMNDPATAIYKDQSAYAIGYQYTASKWQARAGYRHTSAMYDYGLEDAVQVAVTAPYDIRDNYTVGASYHMTQKLSMDIALIYSTLHVDNSRYDNTPQDMAFKTKTTSLAIGLNYSY